MIIQITNKSKNFYAHLGKVFGSREVENKTGDRFYDDDNKVWYIYYDKGSPAAFVSVVVGVIKNVWSEDLKMLESTLKEVNKKEKITESVVPIIFKETYEKSGYKVLGNGYKNFIRIRGVRNE